MSRKRPWFIPVGLRFLLVLIVYGFVVLDGSLGFLVFMPVVFLQLYTDNQELQSKLGDLEQRVNAMAGD